MIATNIRIPGEVRQVLEILNNNGYEAYIVGGCVRDCILSKNPNDWDIATNARPREIKALFEKTIDTGIKHGTVTVLINSWSCEVTTYRIDGEYADSRRPESVGFTSSLTDDLSRRDFSINAIAYHPGEGFIDPFGGMNDIEKRIIRAVGEAGKRFQEDALRMLRAVRFSAQLDFTVDSRVMQSIKDNSHLIQNMSHERVRDELTKILVSGHPMKFILLRDANILQYVLPEFEVCFHTVQNHPYHVYNVAIHTLYAVSNIENDRILRWTMLLHDTGKPLTKTTDGNNVDHFYGHPEKSVQLAEAVLRRLRFDNKSVSRILRLIKFHDRNITPTFKSVRKAVAAVGDDIFLDLIKVQAADKKAQNPEYLKDRVDKLNQIKDIYLYIKEKNECLGLKDLAVNGDDLIGLGFMQGKEIRVILDRLLDMVIENPQLNNREKLMEISKGWFQCKNHVPIKFQ